MAKFLTTENAYSEIVNITRKADRELVFISPYIKIPDDLLARFKYLDDKGVKIILVCREKELKDEERNKLRNIDHLELRFLENLHAKCFYNQESMVITSLNLYEQLQQKKREMGILLTKTEDKEIFSEAHEEANFIVQEAKIANADVSNKHRSPKSIKKEHAKPEIGILEYVGEALGLSKKKGYCIRGGDRIPFDVYRPYCAEHYKEWDKNPEYKELYCHDCGEEHRTSFNKPLCRSCYKKNES